MFEFIDAVMAFLIYAVNLVAVMVMGAVLGGALTFGLLVILANGSGYDGLPFILIGACGGLLFGLFLAIRIVSQDNNAGDAEH